MQTTNNIPDYSVISAVLGEHEALINVDLQQSTSPSSEVIVVRKRRNGNCTATKGHLTMSVHVQELWPCGSLKNDEPQRKM